MGVVFEFHVSSVYARTFLSSKSYDLNTVATGTEQTLDYINKTLKSYWY